MLTTIIVLAIIGALGSILLFIVSKKFEVKEDPRIGEISAVLPQANCGGCGFPGCGAFAKACAESSDMSGLMCPVGGSSVMAQIADIMGMAAGAADPQIAVVRCNGNCEARPKTNIYNGATSCAIAATLFKGESDCSFGCLGLGDCVQACDFAAIDINPNTMLPEVVQDKCVACGACVKACPKSIIELRKRGPKDRRIYVSCVNKDKGAAAKKACANACIGCSLCLKQCNFEAITIENNLSYIDHTKCRMCRKCVEVCPTHAIHELNFPPRKPKAEAPAAPAVEKPKHAAPVAESPAPAVNSDSANSNTNSKEA